MENENLAHGGRGKIVDELSRGRDLANQLRNILNESGDINNNDGSTIPFAEDLFKEVLTTITNSLLFLKLTKSEDSLESNCKCSIVEERRGCYNKSEDSLESNCKCSIVEERRGCYKRRKISALEKESEQPEEDGHQWRKYGQKKILHTDFPRNYYRCTHKYDQGCKATKQVQRIQEDPPLHKTTYSGHHTCRILQNPESIVDYPTDHSSMILSFDNSFPTPAKQDCPFLSSSSFPSTSSSVKKEECKEEIVHPPPSSSFPSTSSSVKKEECKEEIVHPPPSNDYLSGLTFDDPEKDVTLSSTLDSHDHLGVHISDIMYDDVLDCPLSDIMYDDVLDWPLS